MAVDIPALQEEPAWLVRGATEALHRQMEPLLLLAEVEQAL